MLIQKRSISASLQPGLARAASPSDAAALVVVSEQRLDVAVGQPALLARLADLLRAVWPRSRSRATMRACATAAAVQSPPPSTSGITPRSPSGAASPA